MAIDDSGSFHPTHSGVPCVCLRWQASWTACGRGFFGPPSPEWLTDDLEQVTCPDCLAKAKPPTDDRPTLEDQVVALLSATRANGPTTWRETPVSYEPPGLVVEAAWLVGDIRYKSMNGAREALLDLAGDGRGGER